jgi:hypothetical protein
LALELQPEQEATPHLLEHLSLPLMARPLVHLVHLVMAVLQLVQHNKPQVVRAVRVRPHQLAAYAVGLDSIVWDLAVVVVVVQHRPAEE